MLSGSFQNLLNMGGLPSGLNNAVAGVANDYGYGAEIDDGGFRMFPSEKRIQERQEKIKGQQLEADILEQFNKSRTNPGGGLVNIPGMAIGNMQGLVAQGNQTFPIGKQQIPAVTLDGGKTYFDPRDGSPIDMNSLQPKDFFTDFGGGIKAIKEAKEKGGTYMNEETRKMMEMLEDY